MPKRFVAFLWAALLLCSATARAESPARLRVVVVLDTSLSMKQNDPDQLARLAARLLVDLAGGGGHDLLLSRIHSISREMR